MVHLATGPLRHTGRPPGGNGVFQQQRAWRMANSVQVLLPFVRALRRQTKFDSADNN